MAKILNQSQITSTYTLPDGKSETGTILSNFSSTEYMTDSFTKIKTVSSDYATPNEEVELTLVLTNSSDYEIFDIFVKDTIDGEVVFKKGSLLIDNQVYEEFDPTNGFELENSIMPNQKTEIKYKLIVNENPTRDIVNAISSIKYSVNETDALTEFSNPVNFSIVNNVIKINKTANKKAVISGQKILYTITISNEGQFLNSNIIFKDALSASTTFVDGSVKVNDVVKQDFNPIDGFNVGNLDVNESVTITFEAEVK